MMCLIYLYSKCFRVTTVTILLWLFVHYLKLGAVMGHTGADVQRLRTNLLKNYDKNLRPVLNETAATSVKMLFDLAYVSHLDEKNHIFSFKGLLLLKWKDEHLVWKAEDYGGVTKMSFRDHEIWQPDIYMLYSVSHQKAQYPTKVLVDKEGIAKWFPSVIYDSPCNTHLRHYPFDEHNCTLAFGSWTHGGQSITLETLDLWIRPFENMVTTEWTVLSVTHRNEIFKYGEVYTYHMVFVEIHLKRASSIYKYVCVVPSILTVLVTLCGFWLQPWEASRYILGCANVLMMALLLQHLAVTLPAGNEVPVVVEYCAASLCLAVIFLLVSVATTLISRCTAPPPRAIVHLARGTLGQGLCVFSFRHSSASLTPSYPIGGPFDDKVTSSTDRLILSGDWLAVSLVIDRILFWVFSLVFVILIGVLAAN